MMRFADVYRPPPQCSTLDSSKNVSTSVSIDEEKIGPTARPQPLAVPSLFTTSSSSMTIPNGWEPGNWDVICQRGKECFEHGMHHTLLNSHISSAKTII